jgi:hypothetical protein
VRQRLGRWWNGLSTRGKVRTAVAVVVVLGAIGSSSRSPSTDVPTTPTAGPTMAAAGTAQPTDTSAPDETAGPSPTAEPPPIATPLPTAALAFEPIELRGRGSKIARFVIPEDVAAIAEIAYEGSSNFAVWTVNASGEQTDLLVMRSVPTRGPASLTRMRANTPSPSRSSPAAGGRSRSSRFH